MTEAGFLILYRESISFFPFVYLLLLLLSKATHFLSFFLIHFEVGLPIRIFSTFPIHIEVPPATPTPSGSVSSFVCAEKNLREAADVGLGIKRASRGFFYIYDFDGAAVVLRIIIIIIIKRYTSYTIYK